VLKTQQEAWNRKDLEGFMAGYWNSPDLTFFFGRTYDVGMAGRAGAVPEDLPRFRERNGETGFL